MLAARSFGGARRQRGPAGQPFHPGERQGLGGLAEGGIRLAPAVTIAD
jgi:hypothetical protein